MDQIFHRMGDGSAVEMSAKEIMADLVEGSEDAAKRGEITPLTKEAYDYLLDIYCSPHKFISVEPGPVIRLPFESRPALRVLTGTGVRFHPGYGSGRGRIANLFRCGSSRNC